MRFLIHPPLDVISYSLRFIYGGLMRNLAVHPELFFIHCWWSLYYAWFQI